MSQAQEIFMKKKTLNSTARPQRKFTETARKAHCLLDRLTQDRRDGKSLSACKHSMRQCRLPQGLSAKKYVEKYTGAAEVFWKRLIRRD